jgi:hypothetical protein
MSKSVTSVLIAVMTVVLIVLASVMPAQSLGPSGAWRLISPTEYTPNPASNMHGIFLTSGGTSGKGSGNGWAVSDNGFIFFWDGFSWNQAASPTDCQLDSVSFGGPLNPLSGITSSSGWIVGGAVGAGAGAICAGAKNAVALYFNGIGWSSYPVPSTSFPGAKAEMLSVFQVKSASSSGDSVNAFGVGEENGGANGAFWIWSGVPGSGGGWTELSTTGGPVNSVYMTHCSGSPCSGDDGIAVGNAVAGVGQILRFVGGVWTPRASPVGVNLNGVAMSSPTNGWAVGDSGTIVRTTDGNTWAGPVSAGTTTNHLRSIVLLGSSEAWAVGDADSTGATVLHGTSLDSTPTWVRLPVNQVATPLGLNSVTFATSGGNIWSVGKAGVAAFCLKDCGSTSGAIWSTNTSPNPIELDSVFMVSDSDGWAVGAADPSDPISGKPTVLRWDGGSFSWTRAPFVAPLINPTSLNSVYLSGGSSGWAVGGTPTPAPSTLWWDGNQWNGKPVGSPCLCTLYSVYMVSDSNSWAVGSVGTIMHSASAGGSFMIAPSSLPGATYKSVFFDPSSGGMSGWAAGTNAGNAVIVHTANGGADGWPVAGMPALPGVTLNSLFFQDSTHAWAAGTSSTILYWNGISWTPVGIVGALNPITINGIAVTGGPPAADGWAVGVDTITGLPTTIHYDGASWTVTALTPSIPNKGELKSLSVRSSTNGLAVGTGVTAAPTTLSLILHLDPPGSSPQTVTTTTPITTTTTTSSTTTTASTSTSTSTSVTSSTSSVSSVSSTTVPQVTITVSQTPTSTATQLSTSTSASQSVVTVTVSSSSAVSTPLVVPAIPGFPVESIVAGIIVGLSILVVLRVRRKLAAT